MGNVWKVDIIIPVFCGVTQLVDVKLSILLDNNPHKLNSAKIWPRPTFLLKYANNFTI